MMVISDKTKGQVKSFVIFPFGRFFIYKMEIFAKTHFNGIVRQAIKWTWKMNEILIQIKEIPKKINSIFQIGILKLLNGFQLNGQQN